MRIDKLLLPLIVIALVFALGMWSLQTVFDTQESSTVAYNITNSTLQMGSAFSTLFNPMTYLVMGVALIGVILMVGKAVKGGGEKGAF